MALEVKVEQLGPSVEAQAACGAGEIEFLLRLVTGWWCCYGKGSKLGPSLEVSTGECG